jgi:hypothetical protein
MNSVRPDRVRSDGILWLPLLQSAVHWPEPWFCMAGSLRVQLHACVLLRAGQGYAAVTYLYEDIVPAEVDPNQEQPGATAAQQRHGRKQAYPAQTSVLGRLLVLTHDQPTLCTVAKACQHA